MGHLQRLLDRASPTPQTIQPRIEIWSPGLATKDPAEPVVERAAVRAPRDIQQSAGAASHSSSRAQTMTPDPGAEIASPATTAATAPSEVARRRATRDPRFEGVPDRQSGPNASTTRPAAPTSVSRADADETPSAETSSRAGHGPRPAEQDSSPAVSARAPKASPPVRGEMSIRRPLAIPFVPDRREVPTRSEPDVIISIGRIEVRAPSGSPRVVAPAHTGKPADVERLERYLQDRATRRGA